MNTATLILAALVAAIVLVLCALAVAVHLIARRARNARATALREWRKSGLAWRAHRDDEDPF